MKKQALKILPVMLAFAASAATASAQQPDAGGRRGAPPPPDLMRPSAVQPAPPQTTPSREQPRVRSTGSPSPAHRPPAPPANNCKVLWSVSIGKLDDCDCSEMLQLNEDSITPDIYTPAALIYSPPGLKYKEGYRPEVEVARNADRSLRQVNMPSGLTDVVVLSEWEYEIRFYRPAQVGAKVGGIYAVSGAPFAYYVIKNPDPPTVNRLQIVKVKDGASDVGEYVYDASSNTCELSSEGGAKLVTKRTQQNPLDPKERTDTFITRKHDRITSKTIKVYRRFPWGEELVKLIEDADGEALTTSHAYYEERDESLRPFKVRLTVFPDGSWEEYDYVRAGGNVHQKVIRRGDKDSPPPAR